MKIIESLWYPGDRLLITQISGTITAADLDTWYGTLQIALDGVKDTGEFILFVNLHGFQADHIDVHDKFRVVIPQALAQYGWRVGYPDRFMEVTMDNVGVTCWLVAVPMLSDETRMTHYLASFSRPNKPFYTDPAQGETGICHYHNQNNSL